MKTKRLHFIYLTVLCSVWNASAGDALPRLLSESEATEIVKARELASEARYQARVQTLGAAEIIDSKVVPSGSGSLVVNAVKPLVLPDLVKEPMVETQSAMTSEEFSAMLAEQQAKVPEQISMAATVYGGEYSEITWRDTETGSEFTVWTNVNLEYLRPISSIQDEVYDYLYFGFVTSYTQEDEIARLNFAKQQGFPDVQSRWKTPPVVFSTDQFEYVVIADNPSEVPQKLYRQMNAALGHYVANQAELEINHRNALTLQKARQEYLEANPPGPRPTMINFWKIESETPAE